jgi:hypothetical protein
MAVANHIQDINNTESFSSETTTATKVVNSTHSEAIGTVAAVVKGPVTAETPDGQKYQLKEGDPIHLDETITTAADSYVRMVLNDGTVFQLGPQSRAHLDKYVYDPAVAGGEFESSVSIGTFRYISGKISGHNQGQHTLIKTPSAHIGIRGSEIDVQVDDKGATTILHLSGLISVTSQLGEEQIVYEHGVTVYISSEITSLMMVKTSTESEIKQINQRWEALGNNYVIEESLPQSEGEDPNSVKPQSDSSSPLDTYPTLSPDAGARNPFVAATKDVNAGESIDEPITSHETLKEYGQFSGIADLSGMPSASGTTITTNLGTTITTLGTAITTSRLVEGFTTTGLANRISDLGELATQERLIIGNKNTSFVEDEILNHKGEIIPVENISTNTLPTDNNGSTTNNDSSSAPDDLPTEPNQPDSNPDSSLPDDDLSNQAPITQSDLLFLNDNAPISIPIATLLANDQDSNGDPLQIIAVTEPTSGTVQLVGETETIVFIPQTDFSQGGFNYLVSDGKETTLGEVIITHNLAPVAHQDELFIQDLAPITINPRQLLANDFDPNADILKIINVGQDSLNGSAAFNQQGDIVFTPSLTLATTGFGQFSYEVSDGHGKSASASVTITLAINQPPDSQAVNRPPIAQNDPVEINQREPITTSQLLANDYDPDQDSLSIIDVQAGLNNQITWNRESGEIIFTPTATFNDSGQFTYTISDGHDHTAIATVMVTLTKIPELTNSLPIAEADGPFDMASQDQISLVIQEQLLNNDSDPDGDLVTLNRITESLNGTATLDDNGNVIFTRDSHFQGEGGFTYEITDGKGGLATAQVTITGDNLPQPQQPQPQNDEEKANKNQILVLPMALLLANDLPQNSLNITAVNNALHGEVQLDQVNNQIIFTPEVNFSGLARFDYIVTNNQGVNATATVNIEVINHKPIANPEQLETVRNTPLLIANTDLLKNDEDADGDNLTVVSVAAINQNTVVLDGDNILFTPDPNFVGQAQFSYTIVDTSGSQATIPVTVMVERLAYDDQLLPTTKNLDITVATQDLLANDKDPNLTVVAVTPVTPGTAVQDANGNIIFTPALNFTGEAQFQYSVTDVAGKIDSALVKVMVTNTLPVAEDDMVTATANQVLTIPITDLLTNDHDADPNDLLTLVEVSSANSGKVELQANEILFTPEEQFTGEASFKYTIADSSNAQATATVNITVTPAPNLPPVITLPNSSTPLIYSVPNEPLPIDTAATVSDPDSPNFADGTLEVAISPQRSPYDILEIQNQGPISVSSPSGGEITFDGTQIGSFFTIFSTHILVVKLNENADPTNTEALLQAITYKNTAPTPLIETLTIKMTLSDGDGGESEIASRNIEIITANIPPLAEDDQVTRPFNTPTTIAVSELLPNDKDANPTDILSIMEVTPLSNGVQAKLVGNEVQLFIDGLIDKQFEPVTLSYKVTDGNNSEDSAKITITPDNVITGTANDDNLAGSAKLDIILGQAGDDTFNVSKGSDILLGGEGNDLFIFDPTLVNSVYIDGDSGVNILSLAGTDNQILDLLTNHMLPTEQQINLHNIEKIDMASHSTGHNQLRLGVEDVLDLSDTHQLIIEGDAKSMVNSVSQGWHNEGLDNTGLYNRYTHGDAELLVSVDITNQFIS